MTLPRPLTRLLALAGAATLAAGLGACGEMQEDELAVTERDTVTLVLDSAPRPDHAAIYAAEATGAFDRAGLDVRIREAGEEPPLDAVAGDRAEFALASQAELLQARADEAQVQAVAALIQRPLTAVVSLERTPVRRAAQLGGKTVGTAGTQLEAATLDEIARGAELEPREIRRREVTGALRRSLVRGDVDAILASWNDDAAALERGRRKVVALAVDELGVPTHQDLLLTASAGTVRNRGPLVRRLVQAIGFGALALRDDAASGLDPLAAANPGIDRGDAERSLRATLGAMFPEGDDLPFGWMALDQWAEYAVWLQESKVIPDARVAARAFTTEYLAGEGVGDDSTPGG